MLLGNFIEYKGFVGSIEYDNDDDIYYGKLINIEDFINYHGTTLLELYDIYRDAIDSYIEICNEIGK